MACEDANSKLVEFVTVADVDDEQGGITCGAIDEPRKSSKAIDERVIINFCDKNVVIARFRNKNGVLSYLHIYVYLVGLRILAVS